MLIDTPISFESLQAERELGAYAQELINQQDAEQARALIRLLAASYHSDYPQYDKYWEGPEWRLVRVKQKVVTKGGVLFEPGDLALARRSFVLGRPSDFTTLYSVRVGWNASVSNWDVEAVDPIPSYEHGRKTGWC